VTGVIKESSRLVGLMTVAREMLSALDEAGMATREVLGDE
jgi:hypothetical protein